MILPAIVSLLVGAVLGYLAQRSRFCLIGGLRDYLLVRDTELVKGAVAFFVTAWLAYSVAGALGLTGLPVAGRRAAPPPGGTTSVSSPAPAAGAPAVAAAASWSSKPLWMLTVVAGLALGLCSTLANGCPTRQHVLAAQGIRDSRYYLVGFYGGVIVFYFVTRPLLAVWM